MRRELINDIAKGAFEMAIEENAYSFIYTYEMATKIIEIVVGVKNNEYYCEKVNVYDYDQNDLSYRFENISKLIMKECAPCRSVVIDEIRDSGMNETERIFGSESAYINYSCLLYTSPSPRDCS